MTLRVAAVATVCITPPAVALGYVLARRRFPGARLLSAAVGLPLVLPPTAVGFLLLDLLAIDGPLGRRTLGVDLDLLLTWKGAAVAAGVMSFPLVARTARVAFEAIDPRLEATARTLGDGRLRAFLRVALPLAAPGLVAGVVLGFTRAIGEFGATVIVAGNIPGETRTLASAIYTAQQTGDSSQGRWLIAVSVAIGLVAVWVSETLAPRPLSGAPGPPAERR